MTTMPPGKPGCPICNGMGYTSVPHIWPDIWTVTQCKCVRESDAVDH